MLNMDDLWTPDRPLPDAAVLGKMAQRAADAWGMGELAGMVRIGYNMRMKSNLGRALLAENIVQLNAPLLAANPGELVKTLVHELAHLAAKRRYGRVLPHGLHFRTLMAQVGYRGNATVRLRGGTQMPRYPVPQSAAGVQVHNDQDTNYKYPSDQ